MPARSRRSWRGGRIIRGASPRRTGGASPRGGCSPTAKRRFPPRRAELSRAGRPALNERAIHALTCRMHAAASIRETVADVVERTPVYDIHTHLYDPAFGELLLWGIDELLVYHYLIAEGFRQFDMPDEQFWSLSKSQQAEAIWNALFIEHSPISEACRGILTVLHALGLDVKKRDLAALRKWFAGQTVESHITQCMELAGVRKICMTNSPFDDSERGVWEKGFQRDERFTAALRIDPLLFSWSEAAPKLAQWGYDV